MLALGSCLLSSVSQDSHCITLVFAPSSTSSSHEPWTDSFLVGKKGAYLYYGNMPPSSSFRPPTKRRRLETTAQHTAICQESSCCSWPDTSWPFRWDIYSWGSVWRYQYWQADCSTLLPDSVHVSDSDSHDGPDLNDADDEPSQVTRSLLLHQMTGRNMQKVTKTVGCQSQVLGGGDGNLPRGLNLLFVQYVISLCVLSYT